jgi:nucleoside-diphosphate-sugar epimerase
VIGTVTDRARVQRCVRGVDAVQHLAAAFREMNVPEKYYWDVNVGGTRTLLEESLAAGVKKFIYCSTCGVHGNVDNPPGGEDAPIKPADYYQQTKYEAEPLTLDFQRNRGLPALIVRPAAIYGPGDPERFFMIFKRVARGTFPMFGSGRTLYHPLYIANLTDALLAAMEPGRGDGKAYLIADEEYVSIEELVRRVARAMGVTVRIPHYPMRCIKRWNGVLS